MPASVVNLMRGPGNGRRLKSGFDTDREELGMIDWNSDNWGNHVTYAENGSWVTDKHGDDDAKQD